MALGEMWFLFVFFILTIYKRNRKYQTPGTAMTDTSPLIPETQSMTESMMESINQSMTFHSGFQSLDSFELMSLIPETTADNNELWEPSSSFKYSHLLIFWPASIFHLVWRSGFYLALTLTTIASAQMIKGIYD